MWTSTGGTPDLQARAADQFANLVWDPNVGPASPAFAREIRSVYRVGGEDLVRQSLQLRVFAGTGDQEKRFQRVLVLLRSQMGLISASIGTA